MKYLVLFPLILFCFQASAAEVTKEVKNTVSNFSCAKKYCKNMSSCSEAYHKFKVCGNKGLDRDKDGVPCENVCGKTISSMERLLKKGS